MYQKEMKEGFCESYLKSRIIQKTTLYGLFRKIEPYEEKLQKDASLFTKDEAIEMYTELKSRSVYTLMNNNVVLKAYYLWRKHYYGVDVESAYESITIDDLRPCVDKNASKILSREDITEIEEQLLNAADAAIVELLFNGVAGKSMEDLYTVSEECVKGDVLVVNGKRFPMTDRLKELLPKAFSETEVMSYGETMKIMPVVGKGRIYKERCNARGVDTPDSRFRFFYRKIQVFRDYLDIPALTMKNISTSGLWYYLQCGMNETGLDLRSFLRTESGKEIAVRYGFSEDYYVDNIYAKYEQYL
jgi:hypothetical protein